VVATSGFSDLESARNIFVKGAHDFIGKPLNLDSLEMAIEWIAERQRVLQVAERHFGKDASPLDFEMAERCLDCLREVLRDGTHPFQGKIRHALRVAGFLRSIETGLDHPRQVDLQVAALLHEAGMGCQIQNLCRLARPLESDELRLVREQAQISGRLIAGVLGRPEFQEVIGGHLAWQAALQVPEAQWSAERRLAVWLGVANILDGYLHDRPDRPAATPSQLHGIFIRTFKNVEASPVRLTMEQWARVEDFFSRHAV
jgi:hypothetical protein